VEAGAHGSLLTIELRDCRLQADTGAQERGAPRPKATPGDRADHRASGLKQGVVTATRPQHADLCSIKQRLDFIVSRAEANGLLVIVDQGTISLPTIAIHGQPKHSS